MGWGKEWINVGDPNWSTEGGNKPDAATIKPWPEDWVTHTSDEVGIVNVGVAINEIKTLKAQGSNLVDAEAYLYFQCEGCSNILDPHTKSFKTLQDKRVEAGWLCVWNVDGMGYKVYCPKCGDGK